MPTNGVTRTNSTQFIIKNSTPCGIYGTDVIALMFPVRLTRASTDFFPYILKVRLMQK